MVGLMVSKLLLKLNISIINLLKILVYELY